MILSAKSKNERNSSAPVETVLNAHWLNGTLNFCNEFNIPTQKKTTMTQIYKPKENSNEHEDNRKVLTNEMQCTYSYSLHANNMQFYTFRRDATVLFIFSSRF